MYPFQPDDARLLRGCMAMLNLYESMLRMVPGQNKNLTDAKECLARLANEAERSAED